MDKAMGVIAQQDEDIDTLLGIIDCLKAANMDSEESETPAENEDSEETDEKNCDARYQERLWSCRFCYRLP